MNNSKNTFKVFKDVMSVILASKTISFVGTTKNVLQVKEKKLIWQLRIFFFTYKMN